MSGKITIKEIAADLGISTASVSRALNDSHEVSETLKEKVRHYARAIGYQPDKIAANLRRGKTMTIGVIVPSIAYNFNVRAIEGIENILGQHGYKVMILQSMELEKRERDAVAYLLSNGIDGVITSIAAETKRFDHLQDIIEAGKPLVLMDRTTTGVMASEVVIDHEKASFQAVKHLFENGCRKIAWVTGPMGLPISQLRQQGYEKALHEYGRVFDPELICHCAFNEDMGFGEIRKLLLHRPDIDGIYAINDRFAIGAMAAIQQLKRKIPQDVAVVGFNNEPFDPLLNPSLSSIYQPSMGMGQEAAYMVLKHLKEKAFVPQRKVFKTKLIVRDSSSKSADWLKDDPLVYRPLI